MGEREWKVTWSAVGKCEEVVREKVTMDKISTKEEIMSTIDQVLNQNSLGLRRNLYLYGVPLLSLSLVVFGRW